MKTVLYDVFHGTEWGLILGESANLILQKAGNDRARVVAGGRRCKRSVFPKSIQGASIDGAYYCDDSSISPTDSTNARFYVNDEHFRSM